MGVPKAQPKAVVPILGMGNASLEDGVSRRNRPSRSQDEVKDDSYPALRPTKRFDKSYWS
jgi:hypothetical protein